MAVKIVSKELALKLKRLGFDMPVPRAYTPASYAHHLQHKEVDSNHRIFKPLCSAPTYDEVLHWLRDKCGFHSEVRSLSTYEDKLVYQPILKAHSVAGWIAVLADSSQLTPDYEKAQLDIINKAVELLEKRLKNNKDGN